MKRYLAIALAASLGIFAAGAASAATIGDYADNGAANGITESRHNLGRFGLHFATESTTEVCIFCHTPHHSNVNSTPLWNRSTTSASGLTAYGTTIGGTVVGAPAGATLACLSCHDGYTTLDNIVNAPGKDGVTVGGKDRGWAFTEGGATVPDYLTSRRLNIGNLHRDGVLAGGYNGGYGLRDDHPVSVAYTQGIASLRPKTETIAGIDLVGGMNVTNVNDLVNMEQNRWAVKGYINVEATINDLLKGSVGTVECSSCHDPHFKNLSWDEVEVTWSEGTDSTGPLAEAAGHVDGLFLRRVGGNTGSGVCRTCHNK